MFGEKVRLEMQDKIALVTLDNPPMNAMVDDLRQELEEVFTYLENTVDEVAAVIIASASKKAFVAGADINIFLSLHPELARKREQTALRRFNQVARYERPVIAAIHGYCLGGGLELAMACDIRIASEDAQLGQPEANLGLVPGSGGTQRLPRLVGPGMAKEMIFTGRFLPAAEALSIGLINRVVPREALLDEALEMARLIAAKPPLAIRAAKEAVNRGLEMPLHDALEMEAMYFASLTGTEDQKEGARAFVEKRQPEFKGR